MTEMTGGETFGVTRKMTSSRLSTSKTFQSLVTCFSLSSATITSFVKPPSLLVNSKE